MYSKRVIAHNLCTAKIRFNAHTKTKVIDKSLKDALKIILSTEKKVICVRDINEYRDFYE